MRQAELAQKVDMKQSRISAVERPGNRLSVETLVRLAAAFKVGLTVRFVSFAEMINWENGVAQDAYDVMNLEKDIEFQKEAAPLIALAFQPVAELPSAIEDSTGEQSQGRDLCALLATREVSQMAQSQSALG